MTRVMLERGHHVVAVENDADAVKALSDIGVDAVVSDLNRADWSAGLGAQRFDSILACDVLEHLLNPADVLRTLARHVEPSGKLVVSIPNIAYGGVVASLRLGVFDYTDKGQLDRTHLRFFTRRSFQALLLECGWIPLSWEANRLPVESSEFAWHWHVLPDPVRDALMIGWDDCDVYQWMVEAVPASESGWQHSVLHQVNEARAQGEALRRDLKALADRHEVEHASLLEHQKAFAEAKLIIQDLQREVDQLRAAVPAPSDEVEVAPRGWRGRVIEWLSR